MTTLSFRAEIAGLRRLVEREAKGSLYLARANDAGAIAERDPRARCHRMTDDPENSPRQILLRHLSTTAAPVTVSSIVSSTGLKHKTVRENLNALLDAGKVIETTRCSGPNGATYQLASVQ